ncbi:MAG TPA: ABC transporter substrate-binding protein [Dictyobacter sp.]|jgi:polar amino acid transport system substrate-binding protein|nr:ABC transporter substrate-binding protein [Dictyobacter sp.]
MVYELNRRTFIKRAGQAGALVFAGGALDALLAACGGNISTPSTGKTQGTVTVQSKGLMLPGVLQWGATSDDGAPYVYKDPSTGKLIGFELEIANALAALMGITQKQIETDYAQLEQALQTNSFDMIMNGWEITPDRQKVELFSQPYYRNGQQIVVRANDPRFSKYTANDDLSLLNLQGLTVGTGAGYQAEDILASDPKIKLRTYDPDLPFNDLALGRIDAVLIDYSTVTYYVLGYGAGATVNKSLKIIGKPFEYSDYVVAFNKSSSSAKTLQNEINQAITILKNNGTLQNIYKKWGLWNSVQSQIGVK